VHSLLILILTLSFCPAAPTLQESAVTDPVVCATGRGSALSIDELNELLLRRHARSPRGREILRHLLEGRLVDAIAKERGVSADDAEVKARIKTLEEQVRASGQAKDLEEYLESSGVDPVVFTDYMRLAVLQEKLTRIALEVGEGGSVTGEQQTAWLDAEIEQRGLQEPWQDLPEKGGLVLICSPVQLKTAEFLGHLHAQLSPAELKETCYHLLLARRISARMPDTPHAKVKGAIDREVNRRRIEAESDPAYAGVSFERLLASQGLTIDSLSKDPSVKIAALSALYIDETHSDEGLRAVYNAERAYFDGHYGEALGVRALFLQASRFTNEFIPRTFEAAEKEMVKLIEPVQSEEDFLALSREHSEAKGELAKGALHWMPLLDKRIGAELRGEAFSRWGGSPELPADPTGRLIGPRRTPKGYAALWLSARRPAPAWKQMAAYVRQDLRRRFIEEVLKPSEVVVEITDASGN